MSWSGSSHRQCHVRQVGQRRVQMDRHSLPSLDKHTLEIKECLPRHTPNPCPWRFQEPQHHIIRVRSARVRNSDGVLYRCVARVARGAERRELPGNGACFCQQATHRRERDSAGGRRNHAVLERCIRPDAEQHTESHHYVSQSV